MPIEMWVRQNMHRYEDRTVEKEKLEELLYAVMHAPMVRNIQSRRSMMTCNRKALDEMITLQPYTEMMGTASCIIFATDDQKITDLDEYLYCNCSAAIQNILIEARYQGLSTCQCAAGP